MKINLMLSKCGCHLKEKIITKSNRQSNNKNNDTIIIIATTIIALIAIALFTAYSVDVFNSNDGQQNVVENNDVNSVSLSTFPVSEAPNLAQQIAKTGDASDITFKGASLSKAQVLYISKLPTFFK